MIDLKKISYQDCEVNKRYSEDIDSCDTLEKLKMKIGYWKPLALDAFELVSKMDQKEFTEFRKALAKERKGIFSDNENCMVILIPMPMFRVSTVAIHFHVPFGCALHRLIDLGEIKVNPS